MWRLWKCREATAAAGSESEGCRPVQDDSVEGCRECDVGRAGREPQFGRSGRLDHEHEPAVVDVAGHSGSGALPGRDRVRPMGH